jgi:hypothetical protein
MPVKQYIPKNKIVGSYKLYDKLLKKLTDFSNPACETL